MRVQNLKLTKSLLEMLKAYPGCFSDAGSWRLDMIREDPYDKLLMGPRYVIFHISQLLPSDRQQCFYCSTSIKKHQFRTECAIHNCLGVHLNASSAAW